MTMFMSLIPALLIPWISHPLSMGMILLCQTIIIVLTTSWMIFTSWYSYLSFIIMIGGMLVLFLYMTSVASNEKFKFKWMLGIFSTFIMFIIMFLFIIPDSWLFSNKIMNQEFLSEISEFTLSLNKFFNKPLIIMPTLLIIYLLITLIAVIKITYIKYGPMRQLN
uniref:NADH-ubiquinone oxidoreductase chain 6 n=1 Tax=Cyclommatus strigiceps vitalisi TaxID=618761 RepID=A0A5H2EUL3_9SCAR|nr:NADH dehydrogenase subunit 6 [Cyclommatus strigiceps vitalisi]ASF90510.1 NADH dehydrogenase subunit 6 [Cyclommatus strigiceps vitalisi]